MAKVVTHDCATKKVTERDMTPQEEADRDAIHTENLAKIQARKDVEDRKVVLRESAGQKLKALGITVEELRALLEV